MRGFTLIELMVSTVVIVIIFSIGIPKFNSLLDSYHAKVTLSTLQKTLNSARSLALEKSQETIVCPMLNKQCMNNWAMPLAVFTDLDNDLKLGPNEMLHFKVGNEITHGYWQKKKNTQNYIKFNPQGHAFSSATTFLYCPNSGQKNFAKQLVINFQGRIRVNSYLSKNGTPYASIIPLYCI